MKKTQIPRCKELRDQRIRTLAQRKQIMAMDGYQSIAERQNAIYDQMLRERRSCASLGSAY